MGITVECKVHFKSGQRGRKKIRQGEAPIPQPVEPGNIPRVSKLMALAIRFEGLLQRDEIRDYADLARLGLVTRARMTQIMNLLNLAPDIQENILFLPRTLKGYDPISERDLRPIAATMEWAKQRKMWLPIRKLGSSQESVGKYWFRQLAKSLIQGNFQAISCSEAE